MNGVHDMGGMHGMGAIVREENEPVFHHEWERRAFALTLAAAFLGEWNIDMGRHSRERMPPARYLAASYYEKWLYGLELLLVERGLVTREEIVAGEATRAGVEAPRVKNAHRDLRRS
jgi:nitrile hydratase